MPPVAQVQIGTATLADGDPTNEISAVSEGVSQLGDTIVEDDGGITEFTQVSSFSKGTLNWLNEQLNKVSHIMQEKHARDKLIGPNDGGIEAYEKIKPYILEALKNGEFTEILNEVNQRTIQIYNYTINGLEIVVKINGSTADKLIWQITDAWIVTSGK